MTRRDRLERKLEKREEWAGKASARATGRFDAAKKLADQIPFGQPILVGHHSEKHARRDQSRIEGDMARGCAELDLAKHHESKADGLAAQLDRSVFSDDADAIEALQARIAGHQAQRDRMKAINAQVRKGAGWADRVSPALTEAEIKDLENAARFSGCIGFPAYALTNIGASIRSDKKRIEEIAARSGRSQAAAASGGVSVEGGEHVLVTFAEKPEREMIEALKMSGFRWSRGSWSGRRELLPAGVAAMAIKSGGAASSTTLRCSPFATPSRASRGNRTPPGSFWKFTSKARAKLDAIARALSEKAAERRRDRGLS